MRRFVTFITLFCFVSVHSPGIGGPHEEGVAAGNAANTASRPKVNPTDARANDLLHWQTRLVVAELGPLEQKMRGARTPWVSPGVVKVSEPGLGFSRGLMVRDPDGHAMEVVEP